MGEKLHCAGLRVDGRGRAGPHHHPLLDQLPRFEAGHCAKGPVLSLSTAALKALADAMPEKMNISRGRTANQPEAVARTRAPAIAAQASSPSA